MTEGPINPLDDMCDHCKKGAMGILLGVADMAREMRPPNGTSVDAAMNGYAHMLDRLGRITFGGDEWAKFVDYVRKNGGAN